MLRTLISYPKSGRTKLRYAAHLIGCEGSINWTHDGFAPGLTPSFAPRSMPKYAQQIAILIRSPKEILNSYYYHLTGRENMDLSMYSFLYTSPYGALALAQAYQIWYEFAWQNNLLVVDFADICRWPSTYLNHIFIDRGGITDAQVAETSFANMQAAEENEKVPHQWMRRKNGHPKVRSGKPDDYKDLFSLIDIVYIDGVCNASYEALRGLRWTPRRNCKSFPPEL